MFGAVIALLSCAGAWVAWRRRPAYPSTRFRVYAETLLLLVAAACALFVTVQLTQKKSFTVQAIAMASVIVVIALSLIFSITAITTPKSAKFNTELPPSTILIDMYRRRVTHFLKASLVFFATAAAACIIPGPTRYIAASALAMAFLLGSILLPTAYIMARKFDRAATALTLHPWIHWHYSAEEWQAWKAASLQRFKAEPVTFVFKRDWRRLLWVSAGILAGTLYLTPGSWVARVGWAAASVALVMLFVEATAWEARRAPCKLKVRLDGSPPDVYFGDDGVMCDGLFFTWLGVDVYLTAAGMDAHEPRSVRMEFEKIVPNPYGTPHVMGSACYV